MLPMASQPEARWYSFNVHKGILRDNKGLLWKAENPDYDPGLEWEPKILTEAQLRRKQKREEAHAAQASSPHVEDEITRVQELPEPVMSQIQCHPISSVENQICWPEIDSAIWNSTPVAAKAANQASDLASGQTPARGHLRFQSVQTNGSGLTGSRISAQSTCDISHPRQYVTYGTDRRYTLPETPARMQHGNNRRQLHPGYRFSPVSTRDNVASMRPARANP